MMNIENMLLEYTYIPETVQELNAELNDMLGNKDSLYGKINSAKITGMPYGTDVGDPTFETVRQIIDRYDKRVIEIRDRINELLDNKAMLEQALRYLSIEEHRLIDLRYFKGYKMNRIQYIIHFNLSHCYRMHESAIDKINNYYQNMRKNEKKLVV